MVDSECAKIQASKNIFLNTGKQKGDKKTLSKNQLPNSSAISCLLSLSFYHHHHLNSIFPHPHVQYIQEIFLTTLPTLFPISLCLLSDRHLCLIFPISLHPSFTFFLLQYHSFPLHHVSPNLLYQINSILPLFLSYFPFSTSPYSVLPHHTQYFSLSPPTAISLLYLHSSHRRTCPMYRVPPIFNVVTPSTTSYLHPLSSSLPLPQSLLPSLG